MKFTKNIFKIQTYFIFRMCNFGDFGNYYRLIKYSRLDDDESKKEFDTKFMEAIKGNVPEEKLAGILAILNKTTRHAAKSDYVKKYEKELYSNPCLIEMLVRMYYWDFVRLGFPFPKLKIRQ